MMILRCRVPPDALLSDVLRRGLTGSKLLWLAAAFLIPPWLRVEPRVDAPTLTTAHSPLTLFAVDRTPSLGFVTLPASSSFLVARRAARSSLQLRLTLPFCYFFVGASKPGITYDVVVVGKEGWVTSYCGKQSTPFRAFRALLRWGKHNT
jgi:hypothetical protein